MIFIDTSFFVALLDPRDNHERAVAAFEEYEGQRLIDVVLTTNNVVLETITVARYEVGHRLAVRAGAQASAGAALRHRASARPGPGTAGPPCRRWRRSCGPG